MYKESQYRLRLGTEITGFMRKVYGGAVFYSKDYMWWSGKEIRYDEIDEWIGLKDKNRKPIFEWDIVFYKIDKDEPKRRGAILWQKKHKRFGIRDLDEEVFFPIEIEGMTLFNMDDLEVYSYLFLNPDIQDRLDLF